MLVRIATPGTVRLIRSRARVLQRYIQILEQRGVLRQGVQKSARDAVGISVEETDPLLAGGLDARQTSEQLRQAVLDAEVLAV